MREAIDGGVLKIEPRWNDTAASAAEEVFALIGYERDRWYPHKWASDEARRDVVRRMMERRGQAIRATVDAILASGQLLQGVYAAIKKAGAEFEVHGWDVTIHTRRVAIELKPTVGDNYPSILRTVLGRAAYLDRSAVQATRALIIGRFDAEGATYDQVVKMFAASGVAVRTLAEIQRVMEQADTPAPPSVRLDSFEDLLGLARVKRDIELVRALERDMRVERFEAGEPGGSSIAFQPVEGDGRDLAQTLAKRLMEWTGERWMVALVRSSAPTWRERREAMGGGTEH